MPVDVWCWGGCWGWGWGEKVKRVIRAGTSPPRRLPSCHDRTRLARHTDALTRDAHTNPNSNPNPNAHSNGVPVPSPPLTDPQICQESQNKAVMPVRPADAAPWWNWCV